MACCYSPTPLQNVERTRLRGLRRFLLLGAVLLFAGFALSIHFYMRADPGGVPDDRLGHGGKRGGADDGGDHSRHRAGGGGPQAAAATGYPTS